mmetsp:Transcript_120907/g.338508  ORF Transcript_120907/g.338508 Transcript_120907/m.338508 type:complete len:483 (+) Transcript_120907:379-1827(+)
MRPQGSLPRLLRLVHGLVPADALQGLLGHAHSPRRERFGDLPALLKLRVLDGFGAHAAARVLPQPLGLHVRHDVHHDVHHGHRVGLHRRARHGHLRLRRLVRRQQLPHRRRRARLRRRRRGPRPRLRPHRPHLPRELRRPGRGPCGGPAPRRVPRLGGGAGRRRRGPLRVLDVRLRLRVVPLHHALQLPAQDRPPLLHVHDGLPLRLLRLHAPGDQAEAATAPRHRLRRQLPRLRRQRLRGDSARGQRRRRHRPVRRFPHLRVLRRRLLPIRGRAQVGHRAGGGPRPDLQLVPLAAQHHHRGHAAERLRVGDEVPDPLPAHARGLRQRHGHREPPRPGRRPRVGAEAAGRRPGARRGLRAAGLRDLLPMSACVRTPRHRLSSLGAPACVRASGPCWKRAAPWDARAAAAAAAVGPAATRRTATTRARTACSPRRSRAMRSSSPTICASWRRGRGPSPSRSSSSNPTPPWSTGTTPSRWPRAR